MFRIYVIKNTVNNKVYVGFTGRSLLARFNSHLSCARNAAKSRFHHAINKHGEQNFNINLLEDNIETDSLAKLREQYWISILNSWVGGYNANAGGTGGWLIGNLSPDKQKSWLNKITVAATGENNPRFSGISNDDFLQTLVDKCIELGYVPTYGALVKLIRAEGNIKFPRNCSNFRFGGTKLVEEKLVDITGLVKFKNYEKSDNHRKALSLANLGKRWYHNDTLKQSKQINPMRANDAWILGRKKYDN